MAPPGGGGRGCVSTVLLKTPLAMATTGEKSLRGNELGIGAGKWGSVIRCVL